MIWVVPNVTESILVSQYVSFVSFTDLSSPVKWFVSMPPKTSSPFAESVSGR
jgi:hypothetical protein